MMDAVQTFEDLVNLYQSERSYNPEAVIFVLTAVITSNQRVNLVTIVRGGQQEGTGGGDKSCTLPLSEMMIVVSYLRLFNNEERINHASPRASCTCHLRLPPLRGVDRIVL
jgi:hypothetical protein